MPWMAWEYLIPVALVGALGAAAGLLFGLGPRRPRLGAALGAVGGVAGGFVGLLAWAAYAGQQEAGPPDEMGFARTAPASPPYLPWLFLLAGLALGLAVAYADFRLRVREKGPPVR